jgi:hypothetical protein
MAYLQRPPGGPTGAPGQSQINRPKSRLPENYTPDSTLPPGYIPPARDLQKTGAMVRNARHTVLSRNQIITLAVGGGAVILAVAIAATLLISAIFVQTNLNSPETTVEAFYSALRAQNYTQAYGQLSPTQKNAQSASTFVGYYTQLDVLSGPVVSFTVTQITTNGNQATATVQVSRGASTTLVALDTDTLIQNNGTWYINQIQSHTVAATPTT